MLTEIRTEQFVLRRPTLSDVDAIYEAVLESCDQLAPWMPWCLDGYTRKDAVSRIAVVDDKWESGTEYTYMVFDLNNEQRVLGSVGLPQVYFDQRRAELGYWVRTSHTGQGLATAVSREAARQAFTSLRVQRVEILVSVGNDASRRVAEKTGATYEGILRRRNCYADQLRDAYCFSLVSEDLD